MGKLQETEQKRQLRQKELDSVKDAATRNQWGQFATPIDLSLEITRYARCLWEKHGGPVRFLDPAVGTGSFFSAFQEVFPSNEWQDTEGIELDPAFSHTAAELWGEHGLRVTNADFTRLATPEKKFNLILTNPPYVRHHHLKTEEKRRLKQLVRERAGIDINGLAGLYCHFLLLCDDWLDENALAVWLIPSEFMDVNYGAAVKIYLLERVSLIRIHRFCPSEVQFADALVSSAVVVFRKQKPRENHSVTMSFGGSLLKPSVTEEVSLDELRSCRKWTRIPNTDRSPRNLPDEAKLGDLFTIKRGLATGDNKFFVLTKADAVENGIPEEFLKPILPSPRYLPETEIDGDDAGFPKIERPFVLIDCDLSEDEIAERHPRFWEYLSSGKQRGVHASYLASRRRPWYSQEKREPAPFLCTYMGRSRNGNKPFRFIWNKSRAVAANVYLLLYPKGMLAALLKKRPNLYKTVFTFLQNIDIREFLGESRVYGGGLYKLEPKELCRISAASLLEKVEGLDLQKQQTLFEIDSWK